MIRALLRNGRVWDWEATDVVSVNGQELRLADIARLELDGLDVGGGDLAAADGSKLRFLALFDRETGIQVTSTWTLEGARDVGSKLQYGGGIEIATRLPGAG